MIVSIEKEGFLRLNTRTGVKNGMSMETYTEMEGFPQLNAPPSPHFTRVAGGWTGIRSGGFMENDIETEGFLRSNE
jgi:hypothetical protein